MRGQDRLGRSLPSANGRQTWQELPERLSAFKVFLSFGGSISPEKGERFLQVRDTFRKK